MVAVSDTGGHRVTGSGELVGSGSLAAQVAQLIVSLIRADGLAPGDVLPTNRALSRRLGVSPGTLREALRSLEATGAIQMRHGSGTFVGEAIDRIVLINPIGSLSERVQDRVETWCVIGPGLAAAAAVNRSEADLGRLRQIGTPANPAGGSVLFNFHRELARASHNPILLELVELMGLLNPDVQERTRAVFEAAGDGHSVVDAIASRNAVLARVRMARYLGVTFEQADQDLPSGLVADSTSGDHADASGSPLRSRARSASDNGGGQSLADYAARRILALIREDELVPGDPLPAGRELSRRVDVSSGTLREALRRLEALSAIELRHGSGIYVGAGVDQTFLINPNAPRFAADQTLAAADAALAIQPAVAALAAARRDEAQLVALEAALESVEGKAESPVGVENAEFQHRLAAATNNTLITQLVDLTCRIYANEFLHLRTLEDNAWERIEAYRAVVQAVRAGNGQLAEAALRSHLLNARARLVTYTTDHARTRSTPIDPDGLLDVVARLRDAVNAHDPDRIAACFTADYRGERPQRPSEDVAGADGVRASWAGLLGHITDARATVLRSSVSEGIAWSEWQITGTEPDGALVVFVGPLLFTCRGSRIDWMRYYMARVEGS